MKFYIKDNLVIARYAPGYFPSWLFEKFDEEETHRLSKIYSFSKTDLLDIDNWDDISTNEDEFEHLDFIFAELIGEYYRIKRGVLITKFDIYIHKDTYINEKLFKAGSNISLFRKIESLIDEDIYIGGEHPNSINKKIYLGLIDKFPTKHEKKLYEEARISAVISEYFTSTNDSEGKFQKYINNKPLKKGKGIDKDLYKNEALKYEVIFKKLSKMLSEEDTYSEKVWQKEISDILLLLYPKYIHVFSEAGISIDNNQNRSIDFLFVDLNGNVDIVEIKKPFESKIVTQNPHRNNYIPLRELSGTIMQLEKYIYHLNRHSISIEKKLKTKYNEHFDEEFNINIVNPSGLIIMGRENKLTAAQKMDFEVIKRKYKNVIDIITYDSLLSSLSRIISNFKQKAN